MRLFADRADMSLREGQWQRRHLDQILVPPSVRDAVLERAARLDPDALTILRAAAVLASPASEGTESRVVADLDPAASRGALTEALRCGLLVEDRRGRVLFRHSLAEKAVYRVHCGPRTPSHAPTRGSGFGGPLPFTALSRLARHFAEAGATVEWATYSERAADVALDAGDEVTAEALLFDLATSNVLAPADLPRAVSKIPFISPDPRP